VQFVDNLPGRLNATCSEAALDKLDDLKHWSRSRGRSRVVEDAITTVHGLVRMRAKIAQSSELEKAYGKFQSIEKQPESDKTVKVARESMLEMLVLVDMQLEKYWKGLARASI